eukprot:803094_1
MHYRPISSMGRIQTHQSIYRIKIPVALSQCGTHPDEHISRDLMTNIIYLYDLKSLSYSLNDTQSQKVFNAFQYDKIPIGPNSSPSTKYTLGSLKEEQFKRKYE